MKRGLLTLPAVLAVTVLAAASSTCGDSKPEVDAGCETLFCIQENPTIDAGPTADAAVCGQLICSDEQCPTGCVGVG